MVEINADKKSLKIEKGTLYVSIGAFLFLSCMIAVGSWNASNAFANLQNGTQQVNNALASLKVEIAAWQRDSYKDISAKVDYYELKDFIHELKLSNPSVSVPAFTRPK